MELKTIAHIRTDFPEKFGIPRQSGLVESTRAKIIFCPEYRDPNALRGLEQYTHIWLIWQFSETVRDNWSPTVRPPRLGGNTRMGVFATRSPFRPNPIGLSCVKIEQMIHDEKDGNIIVVSGADLMDNTPIYDIKPYLPYVDCRPDASDGFALNQKEGTLDVIFADELRMIFPAEKLQGLVDTLAQDPRPQYQDDPERVYTMSYSGFDVSFTVDGNVLKVQKLRQI